nr:(Fe-S)-binding protein [Candidatus Bathyarchaeota archaeon]
MEPYSSRGKMLIARGILEGIIKPSESLLRIITACTTCGYCLYRCALHNIDVIVSLRAELVRAGYVDPAHKTAAENILSFGNPYSRGFKKDLALPRKAETIFFAGCSYFHLVPEKLRVIEEILLKMRNVGSLGVSEPCCGNVMLSTGQIDAFTSYGERVVKMFREAGVERIITACPGCYETLYQEYPKFFDFDVEVQHITQFLADEIEKGKVKVKRLDGVATFHDPCHLARYAGITEEPRLIIEATGMEIAEMEHNRMNTMCCGGGGGAPLAHPRITAKIAEKRVTEAINSGAGTIVTACPLCEYMLSRGIRRRKSTLKVLDITELVK